MMPLRWPILSADGKSRRRVTIVGYSLMSCDCPAGKKHDSLGHPKIIFSVNLSSPQLARDRMAAFTENQHVSS